MSKDCPLIAVIDDERAVRKALERLLHAAGLTVETFSGGGEFLAALDEHQPDCAVLDLNMPGVSGFDVLQQLAAVGSRLPVIVLTGNNSASVKECALGAGAASFHLKPIGDLVLLGAIAAAMGGVHPPSKQ